jgi:hypothetical protein
MKALAISLFLSMVPTVKPSPPAIDFDRLITAIAELEQGDPKKPGGRCNISYSAWSDASTLPYYASANEAQAMPVYRAHLAKLALSLTRAGAPVTAQTLGTAWRWGFTGAQRRHWKSDSGVRTSNLYHDKSFNP